MRQGSLRFYGSALGQLEVKVFDNGSPGGNPGDRTCHYPDMESPSLLWGVLGSTQASAETLGLIVVSSPGLMATLTR